MRSLWPEGLGIGEAFIPGYGAMRYWQEQWRDSVEEAANQGVAQGGGVAPTIHTTAPPGATGTMSPGSSGKPGGLDPTQYPEGWSPEEDDKPPAPQGLSTPLVVALSVGGMLLFGGIVYLLVAGDSDEELERLRYEMLLREGSTT